MKLLNKLVNYSRVATKKNVAIAVAVIVLLVVMFGVVFAYNISTKENQQFVFLADSFLHGKLDFQEKHIEYITVRDDKHVTIWTDTSEWNGKKFWPLGPFPSILLLPFVALFGTFFLQGYISILLTILNFCLLIKIARSLGSQTRDAIWLSSFFIFGSAYLGVATFSVSWYFGQVVAVTLLLLALYEFFARSPEVVARKRWWLIGGYIGMATLTRSYLFLAAIFFLFAIIHEQTSYRKKIFAGVKFMTPIGTAIIAILWYNWARFGNIFETGYLIQDIPPVLAAARDQGLFSLKHIPGNLYFMLFRGPDPIIADTTSYVLKYPYLTANVWGLGIFYTAPVLLYIFSAPWRNVVIKAATATSLLILVPIITYYGIGVSQIGYRYILDIYPFLFILLCAGLIPKLSFKAKFLIIWGIILNWHLLIHFRS